MKPLKYDVHLTFKGMTEEFFDLLTKLNIPVITIRLLDSKGTEQVMTDIKTEDFRKDVRFIKSLAKAYKVRVGRIKVECPPEPTWKYYYYECHFHSPNERLNLPMSVRVDKASDITYTLRKTHYGDFINAYNRMKLDRFTTKIEKCIWDSDINYDKGWI